MMRRMTLFGAAALLPLLSGCSALLGLLTPSSTTVRLVNDGDFDVEVALYYDDDQNVLEAALTEFGTRLEYTLAPGEARTFSRDCDELQAIIVDDADLLLIGEAGPEARSNVLRDGDDFGCGDTIEFRFVHSDLIVDFDVTTSVE